MRWWRCRTLQILTVPFLRSAAGGSSCFSRVSNSHFTTRSALQFHAITSNNTQIALAACMLPCRSPRVMLQCNSLSMPRLDEEWRLGFELEYAIPHLSNRLLPLSSDAHFQDLKVRRPSRIYEGAPIHSSDSRCKYLVTCNLSSATLDYPSPNPS